MRVPTRVTWPGLPYAERVINSIIDTLGHCVPLASPDYRLEVGPGGWRLRLTRGSSGLPAEPFEVYGSGGLTVAVEGGTVHWHDTDTEVVNLAAAAVTASTTTYFWLEIDGEFAATPAFTIESGAAWPTAAYVPARKFVKLATAVATTDAVTVTTHHTGQVWWPPVWGFWK